MTSSSSHPNVRLNLSATRKKVFNHVVDKGFYSTKFFEASALQTLGLLWPIQSMLAHGGLADFLPLVATSHPKMTAEFLTTLKVNKNEDGTLESINFRFQNKLFTFDDEELRSCFGVTAPPSPEWGPATVGERPVL